MANEHVMLSKKEGVARLTINRPDKMNALNTEMWNDIRAILGGVAKDDETKVLVLTGVGNAFCAGSDVVARLAARLAGQKYETTRSEMLEPVGYVASLMYNLGKPIIGAVNGVAAGAGLSLALLCDIRIASDKARFAASWIKVGLIPDLGATYLLPRVIGLDRALEMMLSGDIIDAHQAERLGLVTRVVPHEDVLRVSEELARRIASGPSVAVELAKRAALKGLINTLDEQLDFESYAQNLCRSTEDHREGVNAFKEKRPPMFKGR